MAKDEKEWKVGYTWKDGIVPAIIPPGSDLGFTITDKGLKPTIFPPTIPLEKDSQKSDKDGKKGK